MTRVSENSNSAALKFSLNRTKRRLENLQLKGSSLKNITKPSDGPVASIESLTLSSVGVTNKQFMRNADYALLQLEATEKSLQQLSDILLKAKEIAIAQASDFYDADIRSNVASEVRQLRNQSLAIANKRVGNRYIFSGYKSLTKPFDTSGDYSGDKGHIKVEIAKDYFIPINLHGSEVFFSNDDSVNFKKPHEIDPSIKTDFKDPKQVEANDRGRELASLDEGKQPYHKRNNIFSQLSGLITALENDDENLIQDLLEVYDKSITRLITLRTQVGSIAKSIHTTKEVVEGENIANASHKSTLVDADVTELFSDLMKQQDILKTTYQAGQSTLNQSLLDFLK